MSGTVDVYVVTPKGKPDSHYGYFADEETANHYIKLSETIDTELTFHVIRRREVRPGVVMLENGLRFILGIGLDVIGVNRNR